MLARPVSLFFCCLLPLGAAAQTDESSYVEELIGRADARALYEDPYWRLLLHVEPSVWGERSLIDDPEFFLAEGGQRDPRAELHATLRGFFHPVTDDERKHPVCRFAARFEWLKAQLAIDESRLPVTRCEPFEAVHTALAPESVTLVFPSTYINNPASMFGHTLLVLDSKGKNRLLSKAMSYAGRTDGGFGPIFIIGSFIGSYPGYFAFQDYYDKVEEYGDIGQRDIWEYELDLTAEEMRRMLLHAWELQEIYSDYYFFAENCSYNLLYLLDVARPSLNLRSRFQKWVIPIDTVKAVEQTGIVREHYYRPSKVTKIRYLARRTEPAQQQLALDVAMGRIPATNVFAAVDGVDDQLLTLALATEYIQYRYTERDLSPGAYRPLFLAALKARSKLGMRDDEVYQVPRPSRPDEGHDANRLGLGAGVQDDLLFATVRWRPAYHELIDSDQGYEPGAMIEFMNFDARYYEDSEDLVLQGLDFFDIFSISARDRFFKPNSWRATVGLTQKDFEKADRHLVAQAHLGSGYGYAQRRLGLCYVLLDLRAELGDVYSDGYAAGGGASMGTMFSITDRWKWLWQGEGAYFVGRDEDFVSFKGSLKQNLSLARNSSLTLELSYNGNDDYDYGEAALLWNLFF